jgi:hypothetical protein
MVERFRQKHNRLPARIVIAPVALIGLGLKKSVAPVWDGVPVECRLFTEEEVVPRHKKPQATSLGVFMKESRGTFRLAACDLL